MIKKLIHNSLMQINRYLDGGYVIHKITGNFKGKVSAYFDKNGILIDAEQIPRPFESSRPVKKNGPIWNLAQRIGTRCKHMPLP
jgi:hypothetical protein